MNCMTYDYRFSMLIHTEFEYRSRYLKKASAIPDIHYEPPLNSNIRAVLELEANFNSEMKPDLDETYFWKKLNEYNDDENRDHFSDFQENLKCSAITLRRIRENWKHPESNRQKKNQTKNKIIEKRSFLLLFASSFLDLPFTYMMEIFKYSDVLTDGIIDSCFINPKTDIGPAFCWQDDFRTSSGNLSDAWIEQYIRLIRRPAILHNHMIREQLGYLPSYMPEPHMLLKKQHTSPEELHMLPEEITNPFLSSQICREILFDPITFRIRVMFEILKQQDYPELHNKLYEKLLSLRPKDAFYLSYITFSCYDQSKASLKQYKDIEKKLKSLTSIRRNDDPRLLAFLNIVTQARKDKKIPEQKMPDLLSDLSIVAGIRAIFYEPENVANSERRKESEHEALEGPVFHPTRSIFDLKKLCEDSSKILKESCEGSSAIQKEKSSKNELSPKSRILSCLTLTHYLTEIYFRKQNEQKEQEEQEEQKKQKKQNDFEKLMTLYSIYLFISDTQRDHLPKPDPDFYQSCLPKELIEQVYRYFS